MTQEAQPQVAIPVPPGSHLVQMRAERRELMSQLDALSSEHRSIRFRMEEMKEGTIERKLLAERLTELDQRTQAVEGMIAANASEMAQAGPSAGTLVIPRELPRFQKEYFPLISLFMIVTILPLTITFSMRMWRRTVAAVGDLPGDLVARLTRMETAIEATALEVERIGEGQRFVTQLMSEQIAAMKEGTVKAQLTDKARDYAMQRERTPH